MRKSWVLLALLWPAYCEPGVSADALRATRSNATDIWVTGHFKTTGFIAWREGLTLEEVLKISGGLDRFATQVIIWTGDDSGDSGETVAVRKFAVDAVQRGEANAEALNGGEEVGALAVFSMTSDPSRLKAAMQSLSDLIRDDMNRDATSDDVRRRIRWSGALRRLDNLGAMIVASWQLVRVAKDDATRVVECKSKSQSVLITLETDLRKASASLSELELSAPKERVGEAIENVLAEIGDYLAAMEEDFVPVVSSAVP